MESQNTDNRAVQPKAAVFYHCSIDLMPGSVGHGSVGWNTPDQQ
jgi:hypothetical protein